MTPTQLAYKLSEAGKNKDWQSVQEIYRQIQSNFPDFSDMWMQYWYARALIETGNYAQGMEMIITTHHQNPVFEANNSLFDYALRKVAKEFDPDSSMDKDINHIIKLAENKADQDTIIDFKIKLAKKYREKNRLEKAISLLEGIDPQKISTQKRQTPKSYVLSLAESHTLELSNLYLKTDRPDQAEKIIDSLFQRMKKLDRNAEKFLRDRKAQALINQGKTGEAIQMLGPLLRLDEWIWYYRLADVLKATGRDDPAFYFALQAALNRKQKPWFKNKVYLFLLRNFLDHLTREQALTVASFLVRLYADHGYINSKRPQDMIKFFGINTEELPDIKTLTKETNKILMALRCPGKLGGRVEKVLRDYGFITADDGVSYYFHRSNVVDKWDKIKAGAEVEFCIGWGYDIKKSDIKKIATTVKVL